MMTLVSFGAGRRGMNSAGWTAFHKNSDQTFRISVKAKQLIREAHLSESGQTWRKHNFQMNWEVNKKKIGGSSDKVMTQRLDKAREFLVDKTRLKNIELLLGI